MIVVVGIVVAHAIGVDVRRVALLAAAVYLPWAVAVMVAMVAWRARPDDDHGPSLFCEGVSAELRAGATLRDALATASGSIGSIEPSELRTDIAPISEVAAATGALFPTIGEELRLTVLNAARSGSQAADLFDEIGSLAISQSEVKREVRIATAPGRATAMLLVGAPVAYLLTRAGSGGLDRLLESGQQRAAVLVGLALFGLGAAAAIVVVWRASR